MKRMKLGILMLVGGLGLGAAVCDVKTKFSDKNIWKNQTTMIDRKIKNPAARESAYEKLRSDLKGLKNASDEERCKFALHGYALMREGSEEAAKRFIKRRSFEPYSECKPTAQMAKEVKWYSVGGAIAFIVGAIGMVASFIRKKKE
jgi:hypothetical protein